MTRQDPTLSRRYRPEDAESSLVRNLSVVTYVLIVAVALVAFSVLISTPCPSSCTP